MYEYKVSLDGKDSGFGDVWSLSGAKDVFKSQGVEWDLVMEQVLSTYNGIVDTGIHQYFFKGGREVGYYTPCMRSVLIFATPREVGNHLYYLPVEGE